MSRRRTSRFVAKLSTYFHLCCKGDYGYANAVFHAFIKRIVYIAGVAGCQRTKYDDDFS